MILSSVLTINLSAKICKRMEQERREETTWEIRLTTSLFCLSPASPNTTDKFFLCLDSSNVVFGEGAEGGWGYLNLKFAACWVPSLKR
jgi:hypothetical protein